MTRINPNCLTLDNVRVSWVALGEGVCGNYNPDDPNDEELLRFDVDTLVCGEWVPVEDASYCTNFPVKSTDEERLSALEYLMNFFYGPVSNGDSVKKLGERLSWISPDWVKDYPDWEKA